MLPRLKYVVPTLALIGSLTLLPGAFKLGASGQQSLLVTLQSSGSVIETSGPVSSIFASEDDQKLYAVNGFSGEVVVYGSNVRGAFRSLGTEPGLVNRISRGNLVWVGEGKVTILGSQGKQLSEFATQPAVSHAFLSDGSIVIASPGNRNFLHLFNLNGQLLRSFGLVAARDRTSDAENRFLHRGRVLVDGDDNIYYVSNYVPLVQKFSADGKLLNEIKVKGEAVEGQQEVARRFLSTKDKQQVGGVEILTGAAIDRQSGHLWVSMNGSANAGVIYEYDTQGEKLREYNLRINSPLAPPVNLTGVRDIAVTGSRIFVLTPQNQIHSFDRDAASITRQGYREDETQTALSDLIPATRAWAGGSHAPPVQGCGTAQPWGECSFNCPGPECVGNPPLPTTTSSNSSVQNCKEALVSSLAPGYTVISAPCTPYPASTPMHLRGGCKGDVTICRNGVNSSHSVTLDCHAPSCQTAGGGGYIGSDCCGGALLE